MDSRTCYLPVFIDYFFHSISEACSFILSVAKPEQIIRTEICWDYCPPADGTPSHAVQVSTRLNA